jgi:hypothetical protein
MTQKFKIVAIVWLGRRSELWVRVGGKSFYRGFVMTRRRPTIHSAVDKKNCDGTTVVVPVVVVAMKRNDWKRTRSSQFEEETGGLHQDANLIVSTKKLKRDDDHDNDDCSLL